MSKSLLVKWFIVLSCFIPLSALAVQYTAQSRGAVQSTPYTIYDPNPNHLWNRLHRALYARTTERGEEYGIDELDPLLWRESKHLLAGPSHQQAIKLLDEFLSANGAALIVDPLKRAMLQCDLWAIFDWSAKNSLTYQQERQRLQSKLLPVIKSVALSREQIQALPDNYADAVSGKAFATRYDSERRETAFLPPDLFQTDGSWVCVSANNSKPVALNHAYAFSGRSVFLIFIHLPDGRFSTLSYLKKLGEFRPFVPTNDPSLEVSNPELPQFPILAQLALVRKLVLIDNRGNLTPTPLTEDVQFRVHRFFSKEIPGVIDFDSNPERTAQDFFEIKLSRVDLFANHSGGLRAIEGEEKGFLLFGSQGVDPFDMLKDNESIKRHQITSLKSCVDCHFKPGVHSMNALSNLKDSKAVLFATDYNSETVSAIAFHQSTSEWRQIQRLWRASSPSR